MLWFIVVLLRRRYKRNDPGYPPVWLRHVVSWRLLKALDECAPDLCWCAMVCWKTMGSEWAWFADQRCWNGPVGEKFDYCGKHRKHRAFAAAIAL